MIIVNHILSRGFMPDNKITIGVGRQEKDDKIQRIPKDDLYNSPIAPVESDPKQKQEQQPQDDKVWGNDSILDRQLDTEYLEEKRRYVRVRYLQNIECQSICENLNADPVRLNKPITITLSDVSMGGIGAVCSIQLDVGSIMEFNMSIDQLKYTILCEVVYCISMDESYRIGLKIVKKNKDFIRHLKILVARISLQAQYGNIQSK